MGKYATREYKYNREAADSHILSEKKVNDRIKANDRRIELENKKYASLVNIIINELTKRKIDKLSLEFNDNLDSIIDTVLQQKLVKKMYPNLNTITLKNTVLRRINKINEIER